MGLAALDARDPGLREHVRESMANAIDGGNYTLPPGTNRSHPMPRWSSSPRSAAVKSLITTDSESMDFEPSVIERPRIVWGLDVEVAPIFILVL